MIEKPGIEITDRDLQIMRTLYESRIMTLAHVSAIHFEGRSDAATKRVQKLKRAQLVGERPRRARDPSVLSLTSKGLTLLADEGQLESYPRFSKSQMENRLSVSDRTIKHELQVMDVKSAFHTALRSRSNL